MYVRSLLVPTSGSHRIRACWHREPRGSGLDHQGLLVHLVIRQHPGGVKQVVRGLLDGVNLVGSLLELADLPDHVCNLNSIFCHLGDQIKMTGLPSSFWQSWPGPTLWSWLCPPQCRWGLRDKSRGREHREGHTYNKMCHGYSTSPNGIDFILDEYGFRMTKYRKPL